MGYQFKRAIVGGTFDHLHVGHKRLLETAFSKSAYVVIGIASSTLFQHKTQADVIEVFETRKSAIETFLQKQKVTGRYEIVPIHDFYGTSLTDKAIEAIVITEENKENFEKINKERLKRGFRRLQSVIVPYVMAEDGAVLSSSQIRSGKVDRKGHNYLSQFLTDEQYHLPTAEREALRIPFGSIYTDLDDIVVRLQKKPLIIAVGDVIANALLKKGLQASISIIDGKTRRNEIIDNTAFEQAGKQWKMTNTAGTINQQAVTCLQAAIETYAKTNQKQVLHVSGEEDLLAVPAVMLSPLHTVVLYGLFGKGVVAVEVSEQNKQDLQNLFRKFQ